MSRGLNYAKCAYKNAARNIYELDKNIKTIYEKEDIKGILKIKGVGKKNIKTNIKIYKLY